MSREVLFRKGCWGNLLRLQEGWPGGFDRLFDGFATSCTVRIAPAHKLLALRTDLNRKNGRLCSLLRSSLEKALQFRLKETRAAISRLSFSGLQKSTISFCRSPDIFYGRPIGLYSAFSLLR